MKSKIERRIHNITKAKMGLGAFCTLGFSALATPVLTIPGLIVGIPLLLSSLLDVMSIKENKVPIYKEGALLHIPNKFNNAWLKRYLDDSDNHLEKKYKLICLKLFSDYKNFNLYDFIGKNSTLIQEISQEIKQQTGSEYDVSKIFNYARGQLSEDNFIFEYIKPLENDNERKIAQKVYAEFQHIGILGHIIGSWNIDTFHFLMDLQEYEFSKEDKLAIKNHIKKIHTNNSFNDNMIKKHTIINILENTSIMENFIKLNNVFEDLSLIKEFIIALNKPIDSPDAIGITKEIQIKIDYLSITHELTTENDTLPVVKKPRNKL